MKCAGVYVLFCVYKTATGENNTYNIHVYIHLSGFVEAR